MTFTDLGLSPEVLRAVGDVGYVEPTPIQAQAIPYVLMGRDVLGCAQTGTGKTASFTLPMIDILASGRARARMPRSLILEPTRELASQVAENFELYGKYNKLSMALLIGGESFTDQLKKLDRGVDVLIATPGRLLDLFERGKILLSDVKTLVIDEADRMLDMGFIPDVERIVGMLPKIRQTLFFSATMPPEIRRLADAFLMNPKEVTVSPPASPAALVVQALAVVEQQDKREALRHLLRAENVRNAVIFCNRKRDVDILFRSLAKHGFSARRCMAIWRSRSAPKRWRSSATARFRSSSPATSPPAVSISKASATSSISTCRSMPRTISIASAAPAEQAVRAMPLPSPARATGVLSKPLKRCLARPSRALRSKVFPQWALRTSRRAAVAAARSSSRPAAAGGRDRDSRPSGRDRGGRDRGARDHGRPEKREHEKRDHAAQEQPAPVATILPAAEAVQPQPPYAEPKAAAPVRQDQEHHGRDHAPRERGREREHGRERQHRRERGGERQQDAADGDSPVMAFGDHMPDFLKRPVKLPNVSKDVETEPEAA